MNKADKRRAKRAKFERDEAARLKGPDVDPNDLSFRDNRGKKPMVQLHERPDWEKSALERLRELNQQEY